MKGSAVVGIVVALVALAAVGMMASEVEASPDRLRLIGPLEGNRYVLEAYDIPSPGLLAWSVDVTHDGTLVNLVGCNDENGSVCNPEFAQYTARVAGSSSVGITGSVVLATFFFDCLREGASQVTFSVEVWAHFGPTDPVDGPTDPVNADVELDDSMIVCGGLLPGSPAPTPYATATPAIETSGIAGQDMALPETGTGASGRGGAWPWAVAVLAATGASLIGIAVLRRRGR